MSKTLNVFTDGGSRGNPGLAACAVVVFDDSGKLLEKRGKFLGTTTNNVAEYQGILFALDWLFLRKDKLNKYQPLINLYADSRLAISQINGIFKVKDSKIRALILAIRERETLLPLIHYILIPREKNLIADTVVNQTLNQTFF